MRGSRVADRRALGHSTLRRLAAAVTGIMAAVVLAGCTSPVLDMEQWGTVSEPCVDLHFFEEVAVEVGGWVEDCWSLDSSEVTPHELVDGLVASADENLDDFQLLFSRCNSITGDWKAHMCWASFQSVDDPNLGYRIALRVRETRGVPVDVDEQSGERSWPPIASYEELFDEGGHVSYEIGAGYGPLEPGTMWW